jgi:hypothetical protein
MKQTRSPKKDMIRIPYLDSGLLILGLLVSLLGAGLTASAVVIDEKTAEQLAATAWDKNEALKQALLDQSRAARNGLILVAVGSAIQIVGVILQATDGPAKASAGSRSRRTARP